VIIERQIIANDYDVVSRMASDRADPHRGESVIWIPPKECGSQNMTSPTSEENLLWQSPLFEWVTLCALRAPHVHKMNF
jgi:hypothetical protein